jgi:hypothetical protein
VLDDIADSVAKPLQVLLTLMPASSLPIRVCLRLPQFKTFPIFSTVYRYHGYLTRELFLHIYEKLTAGDPAPFSLEPCSVYMARDLHGRCGAVAKSGSSNSSSELNYSSYISVSQTPPCDIMSDATGLCSKCDARMATAGR